MRRRWLQPGEGRWFKLVVYLLVAALFAWFAFRLGTALARRFGAIRRSYEVSQALAPLGAGATSRQRRASSGGSPARRRRASLRFTRLWRAGREFPARWLGGFAAAMAARRA